jgi:hypothetical protein
MTSFALGRKDHYVIHRCLADIGGPFYDTAKPFRNWSALPFYQLDLQDPPFVDRAQLERGIERALAYLERIHAQGYTGIVIDNLAHLVAFERAPVQIYAAGSPYLCRSRIYRAAFGRLFDRAVQLGMEVFLTTDMQWSTPPVHAYVGRLTADNPRLAEVNRWALEELFAAFPQVTGLVMRTGEAGGAHNQEVGYASHLLYSSTNALRHLIATLLPVCERHRRLLIVRTWSIGIGELGDLLWSPGRYRAVFAGFESIYLLASVKHGPSDFFRLLPHNPTLGLPGPRQIVEMQNRREYELFGMVPSSVARLHQNVLQHAEATNPYFAGVWAWNSTGGWGGGRAAVGVAGWSVWTELSSALTAALAHDPRLDAPAFAQWWCAERFGGEFGTALANVYLESEELIERGWYTGILPGGQRSLGAIYLPSLLWIWWMRPTASLVIWAYLASAIGDKRALQDARAAAAQRLNWHADRLAALTPPCANAAALAESVHYLADTLAVAHVIRSFMESAFEAAWDGRRECWDAISRRVPEVRAILDRHCLRWARNADFPPLELAEIDTFLRALDRAPGLIWLHARAACLLVGRMRGARRPGRQTYVAGLVAAGVLAITLARRSHRSAGLVGVLASLLLASPLRRQAIKLALPWLSQRFYLLPSIFFETGPAFTEWTA